MAKAIEQGVVSELVRWWTEAETTPTIMQAVEKFGISRISVRKYLLESGIQFEMGNRKGSKRGTYETGREKFCPCGSKIAGSTYKYCSPECRVKYGLPLGRKKDKPDKVATCLTCGNEFSKPWHYPSAMKYCTNACAQKHTRKKQHIIVDDAVVLDSAWEALFWGLCYFNKISVERFDRTNAIEWRPRQWYAPDFWLPDLELAIEIKGFADPEDEQRWKACNEVMSLVVLGRPELGLLQREDFVTTLNNLS